MISKKKMKLSLFHAIVDKTMSEIEKVLDQNLGYDIHDFEINNNIMSITFKSKNKILLTRQESIRQLWLATNRKGYHFKYENNTWLCIKSCKKINTILKNLFLKEIPKKKISKLF
ncbi:iron donor protein CyaY [Buchnera aphidicola (Mollitrichosiphum nigrofasciatum)]|uniref:iron donor protein CyaY n=1 Tax=Buchnera aphidicola TaxID=9 RepID=UPI0031B82C85